MRSRHSSFIAITTALSLSLLESVVQAQEADPQPDQNHVLVGLGAGYVPAYEGAKRYRTLPLPAIDVAWGPFFANLSYGIGINILNTEHVTVGTSVTFMQGYRRQDAPAGIGSLSNGAGARAFISLNSGGFVTTLGATKAVGSGTRGTLADATLSYPYAVSPRLTLIPSISTTWADSKYNNRYFGVNAQQSLSSGLPQFAPGGGLKDVSATLTASYELTDHIVLGGAIGATTLLEKVKDSPIVAHRNAQPGGFVYIAYRLEP